VLLQSRLAPDMFPLIRQVQIACDHAKGTAARLAGKEPPAHTDTETTIEQAKQRIATVIAYLDTFKKEDFAHADSVKVTMPRWEGKSMTAVDFLVEYAQPNFYFHLTTAYAILRQAGVDIGKRDYLGAMSMK
jgi:hypothetical protein